MNAETEAIEKRLLEFIRVELVGPGTPVGPEDDLLTGELLDSIAILRLAAFVTDEFGFEIQPADFVIENFRSAAVIAAYVRRATGSAS